MPTIKNISRTVYTFNVPCRKGEHKPGEGCFCQDVERTRLVEAPDGTRGMLEETVRIPGSVTILAGKSEDIPDWVAESAPVKAAVAAGSLRLVQQR